MNLEPQPIFDETPKDNVRGIEIEEEENALTFKIRTYQPVESPEEILDLVEPGGKIGDVLARKRWTTEDGSQVRPFTCGVKSYGNSLAEGGYLSVLRFEREEEGEDLVIN